MRPQLWMVAGPNGAGKSTLVRRHHKLTARLLVINPDEIALTIDPSGQQGAAVHMAAGRRALKLRQDCLERGDSFVVETTLTGQGEIALLQRARASGFKVNLAYIGLPRVEMSLSRVSERVSRGGHDVPVDAIYRRYTRSLANLPSALMAADRAYLIDNSSRRYRLIYATEADRVKYRAATVPAWAVGALA